MYLRNLEANSMHVKLNLWEVECYSFGHVQNKSMGALGRKCIDQIEVGVRKGGSRPKDFPFDVVKDLI